MQFNAIVDDQYARVVHSPGP